MRKTVRPETFTHENERQSPFCSAPLVALGKKLTLKSVILPLNEPDLPPCLSLVTFTSIDTAGTTPTDSPTAIRLHHGVAAIEILLIFTVFFLQGAWPVPDVNEPYYLGKAIHFWHPEWIPGDFFLDSSDTHETFYFSLGWLALWLEPQLLAWSGRVLTWGLLAWAWWCLSRAVLPQPWYSILTAALFACMLERCHMAGEWVIGGVEAKGFAYVLALLGIESLVRNRWNLALVLFSGGALFHVIVGGWSVVAAGVAWLLGGKERPALRSLWPGVTGGLALSLPGLIPSLWLTWGVAPEIVQKANHIYVFERLAHHLVLSSFPSLFLLRFGLLLVLWLILCRAVPPCGPLQRLQGFVAGALTVLLGGLIANMLVLFDPPLAAGLLKFYWFRLSDVAVPLGIAVLGVWWIIEQRSVRPATSRTLLAVAIGIAALHVGDFAIRRPFPMVPRAARLNDYAAWRDVCDWIARSGEIAGDATFLTPRFNQTFKWYASRSEVANWKEIPQDAESIVQWWDRLEQLHGTGIEHRSFRWRASLAELSPQRLRELGQKYGAAYVVTESRPPLGLPLLYRNRTYAVYYLGTAAQ